MKHGLRLALVRRRRASIDYEADGDSVLDAELVGYSVVDWALCAWVLDLAWSKELTGKDMMIMRRDRRSGCFEETTVIETDTGIFENYTKPSSRSIGTQAR